jgi:hypothetical protein
VATAILRYESSENGTMTPVAQEKSMSISKTVKSVFW